MQNTIPKYIKVAAKEIVATVKPTMFLQFLSDAISGASKYEKNLPAGERGLIYFLIIHLNLIAIPWVSENKPVENLAWAIQEICETWPQDEYLERLVYSMRAISDASVNQVSDPESDWDKGINQCMDALLKIGKLSKIYNEGQAN